MENKIMGQVIHFPKARILTPVFNDRSLDNIDDLIDGLSQSVSRDESLIDMVRRVMASAPANGGDQ